MFCDYDDIELEINDRRKFGKEIYKHVEIRQHTPK